MYFCGTLEGALYPCYALGETFRNREYREELQESAYSKEMELDLSLI